MAVVMVLPDALAQLDELPDRIVARIEGIFERCNKRRGLRCRCCLGGLKMNYAWQDSNLRPTV